MRVKIDGRGGDAIQAVSLSFYRFGNAHDRLWAFAMMGLARPALRRCDDIGFWKLCGAGTGEGFTPVPDTSVVAILATWPDLEMAQDRTADGAPFRRYRRRAAENWTVFLTPVASRGTWSGAQPFEAEADSAPGPIAALTRATLRPLSAPGFWGRVPDISAMIGSDANVLFKIGIGEVPLFHQITFSIWPDAGTMAAFARAGGAHARAIRAVREGGWFREELYARFRVTGDTGTWNGRRPLALKAAA